MSAEEDTDINELQLGVSFNESNVQSEHDAEEDATDSTLDGSSNGSSKAQSGFARCSVERAELHARGTTEAVNSDKHDVGDEHNNDIAMMSTAAPAGQEATSVRCERSGISNNDDRHQPDYGYALSGHGSFRVHKERRRGGFGLSKGETSDDMASESDSSEDDMYQSRRDARLGSNMAARALTAKAVSLPKAVSTKSVAAKGSSMATSAQAKRHGGETTSFAGTCWKCNERGHKSDKCDFDPGCICERCGERGHRDADCRNLIYINKAYTCLSGAVGGGDVSNDDNGNQNGRLAVRRDELQKSAERLDALWKSGLEELAALRARKSKLSAKAAKAVPHRAALGTAPTHELPAEHEVAETQGQAWFQSAADVVRAIMQQIENGELDSCDTPSQHTCNGVCRRPARLGAIAPGRHICCTRCEQTEAQEHEPHCDLMTIARRLGFELHEKARTRQLAGASDRDVGLDDEYLWSGIAMPSDTLSADPSDVQKIVDEMNAQLQKSASLFGSSVHRVDADTVTGAVDARTQQPGETRLEFQRPGTDVCSRGSTCETFVDQGTHLPFELGRNEQPGFTCEAAYPVVTDQADPGPLRGGTQSPCPLLTRNRSESRLALSTSLSPSAAGFSPLGAETADAFGTTGAFGSLDNAECQLATLLDQVKVPGRGSAVSDPDLSESKRDANPLGEKRDTNPLGDMGSEMGFAFDQVAQRCSQAFDAQEGHAQQLNNEQAQSAGATGNAAVGTVVNAVGTVNAGDDMVAKVAVEAAYAASDRTGADGGEVGTGAVGTSAVNTDDDTAVVNAGVAGNSSNKSSLGDESSGDFDQSAQIMALQSASSHQ